MHYKVKLCCLVYMTRPGAPFPPLYSVAIWLLVSGAINILSVLYMVTIAASTVRGREKATSAGASETALSVGADLSTSTIVIRTLVDIWMTGETIAHSTIEACWGLVKYAVWGFCGKGIFILYQWRFN